MLDLVLRTTRDENGDEDPLYRGSRVTVPVDLYAKSDDRDPALTHVYQGTARLYDPGIYDIDARLDYRNGQWNAEPHLATLPFSETRMKTAIPSNELVLSQVSVKRDTGHPTYLKRHQNLPLCTRGDETGRWIPEENLPKTWQKWQYMFPAEDGRVWLPYHCRMRRISHPEFTLYMSARYSSIHWYGDSNSRRTLRPFLSSGKWCHRKSMFSRIDCLCNDAPKDVFPDEWYPNMPVPHWYRIHSDGVRSDEIYADLRNLTADPTDQRPIIEKDPIREDYLPDYVPPGYLLRNDYFDLYYLFTRGTLDMYGSFWERDITRHNISQYREANLVVVQIVTWDASFGNWTSFTKQVVRMADRLKMVYPTAKFIYRTGPFWCCRTTDDPQKKYDRLRFQAFDRLARKTFAQRLSAQAWDVTESHRCRSPEMKRYSENMPCRSAHSRAEVIHLDNQILMNMLVNG
ncbi:hypothetical protein FBU59_000643 [Linderina macrospora]|uniref:Uncharacterized protein n=1 Tax=Linderina macrospora TaxID=4868 RepID=A0ACC1JG97_9FUNG|nr:hypothetical protein FBU59_000643 [Linderina macrospora]